MWSRQGYYVMQTTTAAVAEHKRERFLLCINHLVDVRVDSFGDTLLGVGVLYRCCIIAVRSLSLTYHCIILSSYNSHPSGRRLSNTFHWSITHSSALS